MDELTKSLLKNLDCGVDILQVKFVESVANLQSVVLTNADWSGEAMKIKVEEAKIQVYFKTYMFYLYNY